MAHAGASGSGPGAALGSMSGPCPNREQGCTFHLEGGGKLKARQAGGWGWEGGPRYRQPTTHAHTHPFLFPPPYCTTHTRAHLGHWEETGGANGWVTGQQDVQETKSQTREKKNKGWCLTTGVELKARPAPLPRLPLQEKKCGKRSATESGGLKKTGPRAGPLKKLSVNVVHPVTWGLQPSQAKLPFG